MELALQFVSKGYFWKTNTLEEKFKRKYNTIPKYKWSVVKLWAKDVKDELIELMEKNEPNTELEISFVVVDLTGESTSLLKTLSSIFSKSEANKYLVTIACKVNFQQPNKTAQNVLFKKIMEIQLDVSTAPKKVQNKILNKRNEYVDITENLFESN